MRQSLSQIPPSARSRPQAPSSGVRAALAGALALAAAALIDQLGGRALVGHATALYAPHGKEVSAGLLYGLLYAVAATNALLWLLVLRSTRVRTRWTPAYAAVVLVLGAVMAAALLGSREYGESVFPPLWGLLALLSPAAGVLAIAQLLPRRWT